MPVPEAPVPEDIEAFRTQPLGICPLIPQSLCLFFSRLNEYLPYLVWLFF